MLTLWFVDQYEVAVIEAWPAQASKLDDPLSVSSN